MTTLYTAPAPNGWKASATLEELELSYEVHLINMDRMVNRNVGPICRTREN
jgi:glutathione S-transferase